MSQLMAMQVKESGNVTKEIFFKYDGLGRRIERQVVDYVDNAKSYGRRFFYDGDMIIEEQDLSGNVLARYMNGPGIDDPLLVSRSEGTFVFTKDGLGSVAELTKSNAGPIQKYRYSAYGVTTQELQENLPDKKLIENRYAFTGRELEDETGLYYYRARYYDPELGRFISEDPIGFESNDSNFYAYVGGEPTNFTDPEGEYGIPGAAFGAAVELSLQAYQNYKNECEIFNYKNYDWVDVGISAAVGAVAPGWGNVSKTTMRSAGAIKNLSEQLTRARTAGKAAKINARIVKNKEKIKDAVVTQAGWQGVKTAAKGANSDKCKCK